MKQATVFAIILIGSMGFASCGGDDNSLDPNKTMGQMTVADQEKLCDATNNAQGGYGRSVTCSDGSMERTDPDRASCVGVMPEAMRRCGNLKIGEALSCFNAFGKDLCRFYVEPLCEPLRKCIGLP